MTKPDSPVRTICTVCSGTGLRPVEYGPRGATWTNYERCYACKGVGTFTRRADGEYAPADQGKD
jgi:DnaJ-class molecular chaperone